MRVANTGQASDVFHLNYLSECRYPWRPESVNGLKLELLVVMPDVSTENQTLVLYKTAKALNC